MKVLLIGVNGYVGYELYNYLINKKIEVVGVDNFLRKDINKKIDNTLVSDYINLDQGFLDQFTDCIWLSGYSSVKQASENPRDALEVNLINLINFRHRFNGRFIYASSGSVYSKKKPEVCDELSETSTPMNMYDYTKISFDNYLIASNLNGIGLRFGTVNGPGENIKRDLMINSMVYDAVLKKEIYVMNSEYYRPILSITDLINGIYKILNSDIKTGIYNMCSFNSSIGDIANEVSRNLNVKLIDRGSKLTYNFLMDSSKFQNDFNFKFELKIEDIIQELKKYYE